MSTLSNLAYNRVPLRLEQNLNDDDGAVVELQSVLLGLIRSIVDKPEAVSLTAHTVGSRTAFYLRVAELDVSKIIGENLSALRHLLRVASRQGGHVLILRTERNAGLRGTISLHTHQDSDRFG